MDGRSIELSILNRYLWTGKERWINDPAPEFRLSEEQTPKIIQELNTRGEAVVDLKQLGLIPPGYERVRIIQVDIIKDDKNKLEFDHQPSEGTVRFVIEALDDGTIRSDGNLVGWNPVAKNHNRKGELITGPSPLRSKKESKSEGERIGEILDPQARLSRF